MVLPHLALAAGKPIASFALHSLGVRVVSLRRALGKASAPGDDALLASGDTLVLSGQAEALAVAEQKILRG